MQCWKVMLWATEEFVMPHAILARLSISQLITGTLQSACKTAVLSMARADCACACAGHAR